MITPERWEEIDRIFAAALECEPAGQAAFLDDACADDDELREEVESLLAHDSVDTIDRQGAREAAQLLTQQTGELGPERIGRYLIIRPLGSGGMGRVYLGRDQQLQRPVALKLLSNYRAGDEERLRRFRQEALAASALNHPNILTIHEIGESEGHNFIATEFVDGLTLSARMKAGAITVRESLNIAIQISSALAAAHAAGIIHRDIKPDNIMVRGDGLVKVLDFGIAKFEQGDGENNSELVQTTPGAIVGTVAYMSPEQTRGLPLDGRADLWSLGIVLYEMVSGGKPFSGNTPVDVMSAVISRQPAPLLSRNSAAPAALVKIIGKALQKEPDERYQTAADLMSALKSLEQTPVVSNQSEVADRLGDAAQAATIVQVGEQHEESARTSEIGAGLSSAEYVVGRVKHHQRTVLIIALIAIAIAGAIGFLAYRSRVSNTRPQLSSIAVLPFVNASGNSEIEYVSDGMTDMLITNLSQVPQLSVKAHSSVFRYKGRDVSAQQIGKELNVQAVLNGRVVQRGNELTLHVELVDVQTETALWSNDYNNRSIANLISLQNEIARDVSQRLRGRLSGEEVRKVTKDYTANDEAYQLYLKGHFHVFRLTPPELRTSISYFQQAIQRDPNYALAYVGLSVAYRGLALGAENDPKEVLPKAKESAQKAIELDDTLSEAHTALGATMFWADWKWDDAENEYKRAVELNPNSAEAHLFYAHLLSNSLRHEEALAEIKRAREIEPYSPFINALEGQFLLHAGKPDEALARLRETFELAPNFWFPHVFASSAYIEKGMFPEAITEARRATELSAAQTVSLTLEGYALARSGKRAEARAILDNLLALAKTDRFIPPYHLAILYHGLGNDNEAMMWLERGLEQRDPKMTFLIVEPKWNDLRANPRFQEIVKRAGFRS
jgi:serine/threonine protein kinase/Tfp pilus assembly protein PilF